MVNRRANAQKYDLAWLVINTARKAIGQPMTPYNNPYRNDEWTPLEIDGILADEKLKKGRRGINAEYHDA